MATFDSPTTRAAIYTRISRDDPKAKEKAAGVQRQRRSCQALADDEGWQVVATFSDNDTSAYTGKRRPGFESLLEAIKDGQLDAVAVWHVDRLYRSLKDLERLIDVAEVAGISFKTVNSGEFDLSTSAGKMIARILGSVARQESEHHAERRRAANDEAATAGRWCGTGNRTFGYAVGGAILEQEAALLRHAADRVLGKHSLGSIAAEWNSAGYTTTKGAKWTNLHLRRVLSNPRIAGLRVHRGQVLEGVTGDWEPIIDPVKWRGVVALLSDPARRTGDAWERKYMLSGIARCGVCGGRLYATYPHGRKRGMVYVCKDGSHVGRLGEPLEEFVAIAVLEWLSRPDARLKLLGKEVDVAALNTERAALVARKDELGTLFGRNVIDAVQLENGTRELRAQMAVIDRELASVTVISPAATLAAHRDEIYQRWEQLSPALQATVIAEVATVTVNKTAQGQRGFDPGSVDIVFRLEEE